MRTFVVYAPAMLDGHKGGSNGELTDLIVCIMLPIASVCPSFEQPEWSRAIAAILASFRTNCSLQKRPARNDSRGN
jgi:hypothetical protein